MAGHDNASSQHGIFFQAKQFGSILRGFGPPVPQAGVVGDLYLDVQTWFLYEKRSSDSANPWSHQLFAIPDAYQNTLKWFSAIAPGDDIGVAGDYCLLWSGYPNYGLQLTIYGPKTANGWAENGEGGDVAVSQSSVLPVGLSDEGAALPFSSSSQLVVAGLDSEYILAVPVAVSVGSLVEEVGLQSYPASVAVNIDPLYTAEDTHAV